ncbi:MAG TPA: Coq4 family protein [Caulobacteraceae bacterium]|jgi:ubiquinone biosynthesis protein COQ4
MTDTTLARHPPRQPHRRKRDWPAAMAAIRRLRANKEDTSQVYAIMHALNGNAYARDYHRLLETQQGGRIAYERVELADRLGDEAWRATFPAGSVGAAYATFIETEHLTPQGLVDESHKGIPPEQLDQRHPHAWFFRRVRDLHDIWHVLTGYGRDSLGEMCLLAFSYQETHDLGRAVMALGGFMNAHGMAAPACRKAILEARRRGKAARGWLPAEDHEALLFEPLEDARRRLGLTPPLAYEAVPPALRNLAMDK